MKSDLLLGADFPFIELCQTVHTLLDSKKRQKMVRDVFFEQR